jgi:FkbM family methyltransferase
MSAICEQVSISGVEVMLDEAWAGASLRAALRSGSYERAERGVLAATLSPDDTYLELGCGIGVLATLAAARVGDENVVAIEADPVIANVARETASRNGYTIEVRNAVLLHNPVEAVTDFYVRPDFRLSSLSAAPVAQNKDESSAELQRIQVSVVDAYETIASIEASYLMVDIEGGEMDLLQHPVPECVTTVCVELHAEATGTTFSRRCWPPSSPAASTSTSRPVISPSFSSGVGAASAPSVVGGPPLLLFALVQRFEPPCCISGTSRQKCLTPFISLHIRAYIDPSSL